MRIKQWLAMAALLAVFSRPAAAGPAFEELVKEAGEAGKQAIPSPAAPASSARGTRAIPGDAEREARSFGELETIWRDTGKGHPLPPDDRAEDLSEDSKWRKLAPGEIEFLKPIFRDGVKYSKVWIYRGKWNIFQPDNTVMAPNGNIYWPPSAGYTADFSLSGSRWTLVHEMTHVYQYQQGISVIARRLAEGGHYSYVLDPSKTLNDYTIEQQGNMIADYYDCTVRQSQEECRRRFSPTMAGFLEDAHWLGKDEERRRRLQHEQPGQGR